MPQFKDKLKLKWAKFKTKLGSFLGTRGQKSALTANQNATAVGNTKIPTDRNATATPGALISSPPGLVITNDTKHATKTVDNGTSKPFNTIASTTLRSDRATTNDTSAMANATVAKENEAPYSIPVPPFPTTVLSEGAATIPLPLSPTTVLSEGGATIPLSLSPTTVLSEGAATIPLPLSPTTVLSEGAATDDTTDTTKPTIDEATKPLAAPWYTKRTPTWNAAVKEWNEAKPAEFTELQEMVKKSRNATAETTTGSIETLFRLQPAKRTSNQTVARLKRWQPALASARGIAMAAANLDPHKVAPIVCASVLFGIDFIFNSMSPEDRDNILDILCQCGTTIQEGISLEMNFTQKNYPRAAQKLVGIEAKLRNLYDLALSLIYEIQHSCRKLKEESESLKQKTKRAFAERGRQFSRTLSNKIFTWKSKARAMTRLQSECTVEKKSLEEMVEYDNNTKKVLAWIKVEKSPEPTIAELKEKSMPENKYGNAAEWLFNEGEYKNWCSLVQSAGLGDTQNAPQTPIEASKRVLWLRGGLGTGKTTLLYHIYNDMMDNPERKPAGKELRVIRYFCNNKKTGREPPNYEVVLRALTRRLVLLPDATVDDIAWKRYELLTSAQNSDDDPGQEAWEGLIRELIANGSDQYNFVFLIDALDELVNNEAWQEFLKFMSGVLKSNANVYLLCSSPKYITVDNFFGADSAYAEDNLLEVIDITASKSAPAMEAFITGELERRKGIAKKSVFYNPEFPFLYPGLRDALINEAHGMFEWVKVWLDICLNIRDPKKTIVDDEIAKKRLGEIRDSVAHKSDEYQRILAAYQRLWDRSAVSDAEELGLRTNLFRFVLAAFKPQSFETLSVVLRIRGESYKNYPRPRDVEDLCSDFLEENLAHPLGSAPGGLGFVHNVAKAFISQKCRQRGSNCDEDNKESSLKQCHLSIAELYIDVMQSSSHPYWKTMEIVPSNSKCAATSHQELDQMSKALQTWRQELSKLPGPSSIYLFEFGLLHCQLAAGKRSMSDPLWRSLIDSVIMAPDSALAFTLMVGSPIEKITSNVPKTWNALSCFRGKLDRGKLLYAHLISILNVINEDDFLDLQKSSHTQREKIYGKMFKHAGHTGTDGMKRTAMALACEQKNLAAVNFILEVTGPPHQNTINALLLNPKAGVKPLYLAIDLGEVDIAKSLLGFEKQHTKAGDKGSGAGNIPFESKQFDGSTLIMAIRQLKEDDVYCLLEIAHPTDINTLTGLMKLTPLHQACLNEYGKIVHFIVEHCGADINAIDGIKRSPLSIASINTERGTYIRDYLQTKGACTHLKNPVPTGRSAPWNPIKERLDSQRKPCGLASDQVISVLALT